MEDIGKKIRALRRQKDMTLEKLSARCGLSVSFLSQVERGISSLSIVSLYAICDSLDIPISEILTDNRMPSAIRSPSPTVTVTKEADRPQILIPNSPISYQYLSGAFPDRVIEVLIGEFPPNYRHPLAPHEGEEFGYVLEGHLTLRIGEDEYPLDPGDSYHFLAMKPHGYETSSQEGAKVLWAITQKLLEWHAEAREEAFKRGRVKER